MSIYKIDGSKIDPMDDIYIEDSRKILPSYFGQDYVNGIYGTYINLPMSKYPCAGFTDSSITAIVKNPVGSAIGHYISIIGESANSDPATTIYVGNDTYVLYHIPIQFDTELTPSDVQDQTWKLVFSINTVSSNDQVVIVYDVPVEDINEEFINNDYTLKSVTDKFIRAVNLANEPSVNPNAQLNGKIWLAIGDSYTYNMAGLNGTIASDTSFFGKIAKSLGMTCYSHGVNSSTIRTSSDNWGHDMGAHQPMVTRVDSIVTTYAEQADDVALITFMGGLNDPDTPSKVGTFISTGKDTTCGGCHYIFKTLLENFQRAKIIVILQPTCYNFTNPGTGDTAGFDNYQYGDYLCGIKQGYVKQIAEMYGLDICDCIFNWYTPQNPLHRSRYWSSDKIHLSNVGHTELCNKLTLKINEIFD